MRRATVLAISLLAPSAAAAQDELPPVRYPDLPATATSAADFAPPGWKVEAQVNGDLNRDGKPDLALVLRSTDRANLIEGDTCENPLDSNPRILVVALAQGSGFHRVVADHALIPRRDNGCAVDWFDPQSSLIISGGALRLSLERMMSMGGWGAGSNGFVLRWQDDALRLIGWDYSWRHRGSGASAEISINFLTGKAMVGTGQSDFEISKRRWLKLPKESLRPIEQIGNGLEFDPNGLVAKLP